MNVLPKNAAEALKLVSSTEFKPFTKSDWYGWAGCETKDPLIGYNGDITIILDGEIIGFHYYHKDTFETETVIFNLEFKDAY